MSLFIPLMVFYSCFLFAEINQPMIDADCELVLNFYSQTFWEVSRHAEFAAYPGFVSWNEHKTSISTELNSKRYR